VARTLTAGEDLWLVDGDTIETKNLERQFYAGVVGQGKAVALAKMVGEHYPAINVLAWNKYINRQTLNEAKALWLQPETTMFVCVDNDATRVFLQDIVAGFKDILMIVGGNGETTGQAQLFLVKEGRKLTPKITEIAPEIMYTKDVMPDDDHCLEASVSEPQTACVNRTVANAMDILHRRVAKCGDASCNEIRVDIRQGMMASFWRPSLTTGKKEKKHEVGDRRKGTGQRIQGLPGVREGDQGGGDGDGGHDPQGVQPEAEHRRGDDLPGGRNAGPRRKNPHGRRKADGKVSGQEQGALILATSNEASDPNAGA
jgi:hypothetical protein